MAQGADVIEPDLVSTKDGVLVDRHENLIDGTTDVAERPEFADRRTTKVVDGVEQTGWFTEDFTLAELKTLRAKERLPEETGREVGIIPEIKHPTYFDGIGLSQEEGVVEALTAHGLNRPDGRATVQSFELGNLSDLNRRLGLEADTAFLLWYEGAGYDAVAAGDEVHDYAYDTTPAGVAAAAAEGVDVYGPEARLVIGLQEDGTLGEETGLVETAHAAGLEVVPYTFRAENGSLPVDLRSSADEHAHGDLAGFITAHLDAGVDGFFTDFPDVGVAARDAWLADQDEAVGEDDDAPAPAEGHEVPEKVETGDAAAWGLAGAAALGAGALLAVRRRTAAAR